MSRLERIKEMLAAEPDDIFLNFSLAMEHVKAGQAEDAIAQFTRLTEKHPDYVPAYFQKANTLASIDRRAEARQVLTAGIEAANRVGDRHAADEMRDALALLG